MVTAVITSKNIPSAQKYDSSRFPFFMFELSLFSFSSWNDTYTIMVGCPSCTSYPSIHRFMALTLKITHGVLSRPCRFQKKNL